MTTGVVIDFNAETAKIDRQVDKLSKDLNNFGRDAERSARRASRSFSSLGASIAGVISVGAFTAATRSSLDYADAIGKAAEATGLGVEQLQELRFAGDQTGLSLEQVDRALTTFNRRLGRFRTEGGGAAARLFRDLRIDVEQINTNVFRDVVDAISSVESQTDRAALTAGFFGDEAQKLELTLRGGNRGLDEFAAQARNLGLVLNEELVSNSEAANDQLSILGQVIRSQLTRSLVQLAPEVVALGEAFANVVPDLVQFVDTIASGIGQIGRFTRAIGELAAGADGFQDLSSDFLQADEFDDQINGILSSIEELEGALDRTRERQAAALSAGQIDRANTLGALADDSAERLRGLQTELERVNELRRQAAEQRLQGRLGTDADTTESRTQETSAIDSLLRSLRDERNTRQESTAAAREQANVERELQRIFEQTRTPLEQYILNVERLEQLRSQLGEETFARALEREAEAYVNASEEGQRYADLQREINQIIEETRTPVEEYIDAVTRLEELRPLLGEELFGRAIAQEAEDLVAATEELADKGEETARVWDDLGNTLAGAFTDAIKSGGDLGDVIDQLEQDIIDIILRTTVTEPLGQALSGALQGSVGNIFGDLFGGLFRASGGPVTANNPFIVGERGPELFVPRASGTIIPNGGASVVNNINITTPTGNLSQASLNQLQARLGESINQSLLRNT